MTFKYYKPCFQFEWLTMLFIFLKIRWKQNSSYLSVNHKFHLLFRRNYDQNFLKNSPLIWKILTICTLQSLTGPVQGFPCVVFPHREKPVFITGEPCSHCRDPVFITGISLWEKLHRENPVFITGNGFAVYQCFY